MLLNRPSEDVQ